jgi:hypothetical protein
MSSAACGPNWMPASMRRKLFGWFFEASCIKHDDGYREGGDSKRRKECDKKFLAAMLRDTKRSSVVAKVPKTIVAYGFYAAVRLGGIFSFNYKKGEG